jgi:hypothetical protein
MKGLVRLAGMSWAVVTACATPAPGTPGTSDPHVPSDADPLIARALAARQPPVIVLPERPITRVGRCAVELGPRPPGTRDLILAELQARNGAGWRATAWSFDPSSNVLRSILEPTDGSTSAPLVSRTDHEALALAVDFVVANYDLFGLSASDLAQVNSIVGPEQDNGTLIARTIKLQGDPAPSAGPAPTLARTWGGSVDLGRGGQIRATLLDSKDLLPAVPLCDQPSLTPDDDRVLLPVIGYHLSYSDNVGHPVDVGDVTADDLGSTTLIIHREPNQARNSIILRLSYEIAVHRNGPLRWTFIVDADTGELIAVNQLFQT